MLHRPRSGSRASLSHDVAEGPAFSGILDLDTPSSLDETISFVQRLLVSIPRSIHPRWTPFTRLVDCDSSGGTCELRRTLRLDQRSNIWL